MLEGIRFAYLRISPAVNPLKIRARTPSRESGLEMWRPFWFLPSCLRGCNDDKNLKRPQRVSNL